jgi:hypothetical protein
MKSACARGKAVLSVSLIAMENRTHGPTRFQRMMANFQGLLENEDKAVYPDISAELPGVELEADKQNYASVLDEPETNFRELAEAALHNVGINADD